MLLFTELSEDVKVIAEEKENTKNLYIEGVFMQYDTPNRNNRYYPKSVMENEVRRYNKEIVECKRAFGELNHPSGPQINLDRVSHLIESLDFSSGGNVYGKAKILNTPMGSTVKGILEGGARLGVSTRGLGSLVENKGRGLMEVQCDFRLVTAADIVADPSAPSAFVNGIMENVQWFFDESTGSYLPEKATELRKELKTKSKRQLEEEALQIFSRFVKTL